MNDDLLIVLSPPRSYSSVVATMIGQHPELYGFPELHLFVGDTLQEVIDLEYRAGNYLGPPGLLRTVAELVYGCQTRATVTKAMGWLLERRHRSTKSLFDELRDMVDPLIGLEKSPVTALKPLGLERAYAFYPRAYYLHLTRHPVSTRRSMDEFRQNRELATYRESGQQAVDSLMSWYRFHRNIMEFTSTLPLGQTMRVRGEDVLSAPEVYLPQIAEWLGLRTDPEAIEAMMHPELSPYAYRGPEGAHGGNDGKFMRSPALRHGTVREPSLEAFLAEQSIRMLSETHERIFEEAGYETVSDEVRDEEIRGLSHSLGYY